MLTQTMGLAQKLKSLMEDLSARVASFQIRHCDSLPKVQGTKGA